MMLIEKIIVVIIILSLANKNPGYLVFKKDIRFNLKI